MKSRVSDSPIPWLLRRAGTDGERLAIVAGDARWTFSELAEHSRCVFSALQAQGVRTADRIVVVAAASARMAACVHGISMAGAVVVPLGPFLTAADLARAIDRVEASHVVVAAEFTESVRRGVAVSALARKPKVLSLDSLFTAVGSPSDRECCFPVPDSIHSIVFTSGTTGEAKAAMLTYDNYARSAVGTAERLAIDQHDTWLAPMPLHHVGGLSLLLRSVQQGFCVVLLSKFDAKATNEIILREKVTIVSVVPTMLHAMLKEQQREPSSLAWSVRFPSLRIVLVGGGPLPSSLAKRALGAGVPLVTTYGLTETTSQVATSTVAETAEDPTHCGRPVRGLEVRVHEPDVDGFGTICVRGPQVFAGYFGDPEGTRNKFDRDWLVTGDIGRVDERGCVRVAMRRDDLIVTGGENVSPAEVEAVLCDHPDVESAGVYPVPDEKWGQRVAAAIVLRPGMVLDAEALSVWCRVRLAAFKVPRQFEARDSLPTTTAGKLRRFLLPRG